MGLVAASIERLEAAINLASNAEQCLQHVQVHRLIALLTQLQPSNDRASAGNNSQPYCQVSPRTRVVNSYLVS